MRIRWFSGMQDSNDAEKPVAVYQEQNAPTEVQPVSPKPRACMHCGETMVTSQYYDVCLDCSWLFPRSGKRS